MGVDREFRIKITTAADVSGIREQKDALDEVSKGTIKSTEANKEHHESFVHAESSGRAFHHLLREIATTSPELGAVLRIALSPIGGLMMTAVAAFKALNDAEEESIKKSAEAGDAARQPFTDTKETVRAVIAAVKELDAAYNEWVKHVGEDTHKIQTALDAEIRKLELEAEAIRKLIAAKAEAEKATIDEDKRAGRITPEEAERRKSAVDASARKETDSANATLAMVELAKTETAQAKAAAELASAVKASQAAHEAAADPNLHAAATDLPKKAAAAKADLEKAKAAEAKADEAQREADLRVRYPHLIDQAENALTPGINRGTARAQQEYSNAEHASQVAMDQRTAQAKLAEQYENQAAAAKSSLDEKTRADAEAKKKVDEASAEEKALRERAAALKVKTGIDAQSAAETEPFKKLKEAQATPFGRAATGDIEEGEATAKALEQHKQVSDESKNRLVDIASAVAGHSVSLKEAVQMMHWASTNIGNFTTDVLRLADAMGGLAGAQSALTGKVASIEGQVAQIKEQARNSHNP